MWMFVFMAPKNQAVSAEEQVADLRAEFPEMTMHADAGDHLTAFIPAKLTEEQAGLILDNKALPGSGLLMWIQPWMLKDIERAYATNKARRSTEGGNRPSLSDLLSRL